MDEFDYILASAGALIVSLTGYRIFRAIKRKDLVVRQIVENRDKLEDTLNAVPESSRPHVNEVMAALRDTCYSLPIRGSSLVGDLIDNNLPESERLNSKKY